LLNILEHNYLAIAEQLIVDSLFKSLIYDIGKFLNLESYYLVYAHNRYICFIFRFFVEPSVFEKGFKKGEFTLRFKRAKALQAWAKMMAQRVSDKKKAKEEKAQRKLAREL
jgi:hypothetical protein